MSEFNGALPPHDDHDLPRAGDHSTGEAEQITVSPVGKRKRIKEKTGRSVVLRATYWLIGLVTLSVLAYGGFYAFIWWKAEHNILHSNAIDTLGNNSHGGMDLLVMGLDTRLNEKGKPLPAHIYDALHAGEANDGGQNSNVLMYVHIPADHSRAVAISIPRDNWVDIPGCKDDQILRNYVGSYCKGKIKSAYGWAFAAAQEKGMNWEQAKNVARLEEVKTVQQFLGVKISSFVEVTMVAFFQMAEVVQPIQVCLKEDTSDIRYSGANFKKGLQEISAKQSVAFVRQRRDPNTSLNFTDLDRSRRQQAFIVSLLTKLKSAGTLTNPFKVNKIVDVASDNIVLSKGLDVLDAAKLASNLSGGNLHFYTLPVKSFKNFQASPGQHFQEANEVDVPQIQAIVQHLLNPNAPVAPAPPTAKPTTIPLGTGYTVNTRNASTVNKKASSLRDALKTFKYTAGTAEDAGTLSDTSTITYNPADKAAAQALRKRLNGAVTLTADPQAASHVLTLTIGRVLANEANPLAKTTTTTKPAKKKTKLPPVVSATGGGADGPAANDLTDLEGSGIPCVK